jgi:tetratricopeptide (TPR) repeat protein
MPNTMRPCLPVQALSLTLLLSSTACAGAASGATAATTSARPPAAAELFERGLGLAARGDALRAEQYLVLAMRAGHPEERVIVPLVRVCIASSRLRAALAHAQPYLQRRPDTWQLRYLTAAIHLALGQELEALTELQRLLSQRPNAAQAHYLLGVVLRDAFHDAVTARVSFETYLRHAPDGARAQEVLSWLAQHPKAAAHSRATTTAAHEKAAP